MLQIKGIDIKDNRVRRVGGGGKCGANCVSIHTTGREELSTEIRVNCNRHIIENWDEIYKDSFVFPYNARIGGTNMIFNNEKEFLIFLMEKEADASAI